MRADEYTVSKKIPLAMIRRSIRSRLRKQDVSMDGHGLLSVRGKPFIQFGVGEDDCIEFLDNRLFEILEAQYDIVRCKEHGVDEKDEKILERLQKIFREVNDKFAN